MRNRILLLVLVMLALASSAFADRWVSHAPLNGSTIVGSTTELFQIEINETVTSSFLYLNGAGPYGMDNTGNISNTTKDVLTMSELSWYPFYFITNGHVSPTYTFYLNKVPAAPVWAATPYTSTETSVTLDWDDNSEADLEKYLVYRNGTNIGNTTNSTYTDTNVTIAETWNYTVSAMDNESQEGTNSTIQTVTVTDATPPNIPNVTVTAGTCSNVSLENKSCTTTALNPTVTFDYLTENTTTFTLMSGGTEYFDDSGKQVYNVPMTFAADGTYFFEANATDSTGNQRLTGLTVVVNNGTLQFNVTVNNINQVTTTSRFGVKTSALADGSDWFVLGYNVTMYYNAVQPLYLRATMPDITGPQTIQVNETIQPFMFCAEDYDAVTETYDGSGPRYFLDNTEDASQNAINCSDANAGDEVDYSIYLHVPIPAGTSSGSYSMGIDTWYVDVTP